MYHKKILEISLKDDIPRIKVLGRNVISYYKHWICKFSYDEYCNNNSPVDYRIEKITKENIELCSMPGGFSVNRMKKYLYEQSSYVEGFLFFDKRNIPFGYSWIMFNGGNEYQYKVRNVPAFNFNNYIRPDFRGKGLIGSILNWELSYLKTLGIDYMLAAVRTNNYSAIKAYEKIGLEKLYTKSFFRILKFNFPYHKL